MKDQLELEEYVKKQLELHKRILLLVKNYADGVLRDVFGLEPERLMREDPSTYYAIVMELARSIFVNWSVESRRRGVNVK